MPDFTQSTYTVGGWRAEFVEDIGSGDYPLIFDLYDRRTRTWLGRGMFTRDGEMAIAIDGYDLAPPGPPPRNLFATRRQAEAMRHRPLRDPAASERLVQALFTEQKEETA